MTSRSEALLEALQQVDSSIVGIDARISEAVRILENSNNEHATAVKEAARIRGESLNKAVNTGVGGLIVVAVINIIGSVIETVLKLAIERAKTNAQEIEIVESIWLLQQKYGAMTYNFALKRSYANNSTTDERRTLLNGLIMAGIIQDNYQGDPNLLFIDKDADEFIEFYSWVEQIAGVKLINDHSTE